MSRFSDLAAKIASEYIESTGLEGYSIRAEDMAHEFADKAGEIRDLLLASEDPEVTEIQPLVGDLEEMLVGINDAISDLIDREG
jgi:hypothetical protein